MLPMAVTSPQEQIKRKEKRMKYTLKQWRGVKGKTQAELSEASGVPITKIAVWETISAEDIRRISSALDLKPNDSIVLP